jgi:hypothetical protein
MSAAAGKEFQWNWVIRAFRIENPTDDPPSIPVPGELNAVDSPVEGLPPWSVGRGIGAHDMSYVAESAHHPVNLGFIETGSPSPTESVVVVIEGHCVQYGATLGILPGHPDHGVGKMEGLVSGPVRHLSSRAGHDLIVGSNDVVQGLDVARVCTSITYLGHQRGLAKRKQHCR